MILKQFIDAGWYTVPLEGELVRTSEGKKTGVKFELGWKSKYCKEFNTSETELAGSLTGEQSGIVAIDCDNEDTYNLFRSLDTDYDFVFVSKGKTEGGGTIIYKYEDDFKNNFKLVDGIIALDFYANDGFIFLPTENNFTKERWAHKKLPEIKPLPESIKTLLRTFSTKIEVPQEPKKSVPGVSNRLAPMLENFCEEEQYSPILFKIITPKDFRDISEYVTTGHLHPSYIPKGRGSEYLSKVSAIMGADISVSKELYYKSMMLINKLMSEPPRSESLEKQRLDSTIINPMMNERVLINNEPVWNYDRYWSKIGLIATTMRGDYIEIFYDDVKGLYYLVNYTSLYVRLFKEKRLCISTLRTLVGQKFTEDGFDKRKRIIRTELNPSRDFGHIEGEDSFNLFQRSKYLDVLNNPLPYAKEYKEPIHILKYFNSLIPDKEVRGFVLSFVKTKFTSFDYSPLILYLIGISGSGKDTFVKLLSTILGEEYVAKPDSKEFLEQWNDWMIDKFLAQLDEYGNKLNRQADKNEVLGKLKNYSGTDRVQIRAMRQGGMVLNHRITFILTANTNPLPIEDNDRRIVYVRTPNKLQNEKWVEEVGGISNTMELLNSELMDFCYYLATEVSTLTPDEYVTPPFTPDKELLILEGMSTYKKIAYFIGKRKYRELEDLFIEYKIPHYKQGWSNGKLLVDKLLELYSAITEGQGQDRVLVKELRDIGVSKIHTTRKGENVFIYRLPYLDKYVDQSDNINFPEEDDIDNEIDIDAFD